MKSAQVTLQPTGRGEKAIFEFAGVGRIRTACVQPLEPVEDGGRINMDATFG